MERCSVTIVPVDLAHAVLRNGTLLDCLSMGMAPRSRTFTGCATCRARHLKASQDGFLLSWSILTVSSAMKLDLLAATADVWASNVKATRLIWSTSPREALVDAREAKTGTRRLSCATRFSLKMSATQCAESWLPVQEASPLGD